MNRKPHGFWKDWRNVREKLIEIVNELGYFPSQRELAERRYTGMLDAIGDYFGGLSAVRKKLGYKSDVVESGKWKDKEFAIKQARKVIKLHNRNRLPSQRELINMGYSSLAVSISKYHSGFNKFRDLLGEESLRHAYGIWRNKEFVIEEAKKLIEKHGFNSLPDNKKLREMGYASLANAISNYHGGYRAFRGILGEEQKRREEGLLKNRKYVIEQLRSIMKERKCDTIPSSHQLRKWGYLTLDQAVYKYHSGFRELRRSLGETQRKEKDGSWKDLNFTIEKAKEFLDTHPEYKTLPGSWTLHKLGYNGLIRAIIRYHGGFDIFRQALNERLGISSNNKLENIIDDYIGGSENDA